MGMEMAGKIVYSGSPSDPRTKIARDLVPHDLKVVFVDPALPIDQRMAVMAECEVLIIDFYDALELEIEHVSAMPRLRLLQLTSAGFDKIDVAAIESLGVTVANNSDAISNSVAEHTIMLILMVYKRAAQCIDGARNGLWQTPAKSGPHGRLYELTGQTVGIVGLGHIGGAVARRLRGFDTNTLYCDVTDFSELEDELGLTRVSLDELLVRSHVVTVHVPLNAATTALFGVDEFSKMRSDAIFINTCRGAVHDEPALISALQSGKIAAAGLDVTALEPTELDNPLLSMDNALVTPHIAGSSHERDERAMRFSFKNARRVLEKRAPLSRVQVSA